MYFLRKIVVLLVVSVLSLGGAVQAASGSDGKGSDKHTSSGNKKSSDDKDHKSSDDKDHKSSNGESKKGSNDDQKGLSGGESHQSSKDNGRTFPDSENRDSWDGKVFGGHDFNPGLGHGGEHWNDYLTSSIPEPETYAMLLAGLSLLGFLTHRKKKDL